MPLHWITQTFLAATIALTACTPTRNAGAPPATCGQDARVTTTPATSQIPIVKSFDDLLKSPPITAGPEQLHLGLEATTCPANSGFLLYCSPLSNHSNFNQPASIPWEERLGPVRVKIVYPGKNSLEYARELRDYAIQKTDGPIMFIFAVCPREPGPCEIQILAPDNTLLAHRQIQVTAPIPSPWLTFNPPEIREKFEEGVPQHYALAATHALPKYDGSIPWPQTNPLLLCLDPHSFAMIIRL